MQKTKRRAGALGGALASVAAGVVVLVVAGGFGFGVGIAGASGGGGALAHAKSQLIVHSDFPKNWTANGTVTTNTGSGQGSFPGADQLAGCLGVNPKVLTLNTPAATSPTFQTADGRDSAQENLSIYPSAKVAAQGYRALSSAKAPGCLTTLFQGSGKSELANALGHGIALGTVTVTAVPRSVLGSHATGFVISFPASAQGQTFHAAISIVDVLRGKLGAQLMLSAVGGTFPAGLEKHLVAVAYSRA
jgi:hypothetical protein